MNTNLLHEQIRLLRTEKELLEIPEDSKDMYETEIIKEYIDRPTIEKFSALSLCLGEFATMCHKKISYDCHKKISYDDNNFQSDNLPDPIDTNDNKLIEFPKLIKLSA